MIMKLSYWIFVTFLFMVFSCQEVKEVVGGECHMQSPVNIISGGSLKSNHKVLVHYQKSKERVANLGHTVEIEYDSGSYLTYDGLDYQFKQFHFHTPSEHLVNGEKFDMELHIVHTYEENGEGPQYLVIGILFKEGEENDFLNTFLDVIPKEEGEVFVTNKIYIDATALIPNELHEFYNYRGSLTTPPYTESVNWILLKKIRSASKKQIERIKKVEGKNDRNAQILYDRVVEEVN